MTEKIYRLSDTRDNLQFAFWELYKLKPIEKISVKEITTKAGYTRGTFYLYFDDVYDMLNRIKESFLILIEKFTISMLNMTFKNQKPTQEDYRLFNLVKKHLKDFRFLLLENGDIEFQKRYFDVLATHFSKQINTSEIPKNLIYFYVSGQMGFIILYLSNNSSCTLDELIRDLNLAINYKI